MCENAGGRAAIVYQQGNAMPKGKLSTYTDVTIPVVSITNVDGNHLLQFVGSTATFSNNDGYMYLDGTSMAAPHVAGAATFIWSSCRSCTNRDVEGCLKSTAMDLGEQGFDNKFGHGLVQTQSALNCLRAKSCC